MPTDSFLPVAFAFWLSHIARYAPSPARQNPLDMNDPKFTFIFKQPLSSKCLPLYRDIQDIQEIGYLRMSAIFINFASQKIGIDV